MRLAKTMDEYAAIGTMSTDFVRSKVAWTAAIKNQSGMLSKLSDGALDEFENSMRFSRANGMLRSANCTKISKELGDNIAEFFTLFGADPTLLGMFYPYKCNEGTGDCDSY